MDLKSLFKTLFHAALGGFAAGLMTIPAGAPITTRTILYPALGSAVTSVISLWTRAGSIADRK